LVGIIEVKMAPHSRDDSRRPASDRHSSSRRRDKSDDDDDRRRGTGLVAEIDDEIRVHEGIGQTMTRTAPSIVIGAYHPTEGIGKKVMKKAKEENGEGRIRQRPIVVETMTAEGVGLER